MIIVLLANGFEEIEAITPVDLLRRAGETVVVAGLDSLAVTGAHGVTVTADSLAADVVNSTDRVECLILPGGMPGTTNLDRSPITDALIEKTVKQGGRLAAICAAPSILGKRGLLDGKTATCYPSFEKFLLGATVVEENVVTDGLVTTSRGAGTALDFALELVAILVSPDEAADLSRSVIYK